MKPMYGRERDVDDDAVASERPRQDKPRKEHDTQESLTHNNRRIRSEKHEGGMYD